MATRLNIFRRRHDTQRLVTVNGRENHALALDAHHLARGKVGDKKDALANQRGRVFVELGNTTEDGAVGARAVVDGKFQQFLRLLRASVLHQNLGNNDCVQRPAAQ